MCSFVFSLIMTIFIVTNSSIAFCQVTTSFQKDYTAILSITNTMEQLAELLPGTYDNTKQHQANPTDFYHVMMEINRIWPDRDDAFWFYVKQAQFELRDHPYQEGAYKIYRGERDTLIIELYKLEPNHTAIGVIKNDSFWQEQHPETLLLREGCAIYLTRRSSGYFIGKTYSNTCPCSCSLKSAVAMESQITISLDALKIWDQGFDTRGKKVWGPDKGAYYFERYRE